MVSYGIILRCRLLPPPQPCLFLCCLLSSPAVRRPSSAACHPPPVIRCLLLLQNLPPNLVECCRSHRPLLPHHSPPRRLNRHITRRLLSTQQHCHHCHCCNPLLTPTALTALSASHYPLLSRCLPIAAIVVTTPFLLQPLLSRLPPPTLVAPSYRQCYDIPPAVVVVTPRCRSCETLMSTSTLASTAFASCRQPLAERHCRVRFRRCHCCHCCCHLHVLVVIAATPTIAEPTPPGEPSRHHLPVR
jgi:hypothetical protein